MSITQAPPLQVDTAVPTPAGQFLADVLCGLAAPQKELPSKYFYDEAGSQLFEQICQLEEYYLTRAELAIMHRHAVDMAALLGRRCLLVEYGSGSSTKTRLLLDHLVEPVAYVPVDISCVHLWRSAGTLGREYPRIAVLPLCADFTRSVALPDIDSRPVRRVVYFPGSTIGNFTVGEALPLLRRTARLCGPGGGLLLGADLKKDPAVLHAAYNDARGVTAAFNLNLLARINRELGADFRLDQFWHYAPYNPREGRIEMHLLSRREQHVDIGGRRFFFAEGESIRTEYSYKYTLSELRALAAAAGFEVQQAWTDDAHSFSVLYLTAA